MWYVLTFMLGGLFGFAVMCLFAVSGLESRREEERERRARRDRS